MGLLERSPLVARRREGLLVGLLVGLLERSLSEIRREGLLGGRPPPSFPRLLERSAVGSFKRREGLVEFPCAGLLPRGEGLWGRVFASSFTGREGLVESCSCRTRRKGDCREGLLVEHSCAGSLVLREELLGERP